MPISNGPVTSSAPLVAPWTISVRCLRKVGDGALDTNLSVAAVSGMGGAVEGLHAVKGRGRGRQDHCLSGAG